MVNIQDMIRQPVEENTRQMSWGEISWLIGMQQVPGAEQTLGVVTIYPGKRNPLHAHPNCEELLYVISGECEHKLGDQLARLSPGMVICIPRGVPHWARCVSSDPLVILVSFSSPDRQTENFEDGEIA
jgi:quercetin dioxygenase-like cupin family protein